MSFVQILTAKACNIEQCLYPGDYIKSKDSSIGVGMKQQIFYLATDTKCDYISIQVSQQLPVNKKNHFVD